jgi:hypothetical protein
MATDFCEYYDAGDPADNYPPHMAIYETLLIICEDQRGIMDKSVDVSVLSSVLGALPRLREVRLSFCDTVEQEDWFQSEMTMPVKSYEYHIRVISNAIESARNNGAVIHTIGLSCNIVVECKTLKDFF